MADFDPQSVIKANANFKEVYASKIENLKTDSSILSSMIPFAEGEKIGNQYHQPVVVTGNGGITYGNGDMGAYPLRSSRAMALQDAKVSDCEMILRANLSYSQINRASSDKNSFVRTTGFLVTQMAEDLSKREEIGYLYGGSGVGDFTTAAGDASIPNSVTLNVVPGEWSDGAWSGSEDSTALNFYVGTTPVSSGDDAVFVVKKVDTVNQTLIVQGTAAGATALLAQSDVTAYFDSAYGIEGLGLKKIFSTKGDLFGIDNTKYNLWQATDRSATPITGGLSTGKLIKEMKYAVGRGLREETICLVSVSAWTDLTDDILSRRRFGKDEKDTTVDGTQHIEIITPAGRTRIIPHLYVKDADIFVFPKAKMVRIGSTDITFNLPSSEGQGKFFLHLPNNAGVELRAMTANCIFTSTPAKCLYTKVA